MGETFLGFPAGTHREEIWYWFDERYSKGVYGLIYGRNGALDERLKAAEEVIGSTYGAGGEVREEQTMTVVEFCPNCETEVEMQWDVNIFGYKAYCPHCGGRLMLCDACLHPDGEYNVGECDYCSRTDSCKYNLSKKE